MEESAIQGEAKSHYLKITNREDCMGQALRV